VTSAIKIPVLSIALPLEHIFMTTQPFSLIGIRGYAGITRAGRCASQHKGLPILHEKLYRLILKGQVFMSIKIGTAFRLR
jgi:hypothetical protein